MTEVTYAEPTTRTPLHFDVLPPIEQSSPITTTTPTKQPFTVNQDAPGQLTIPSDYHAGPHTMPSVQEQIKNDGATWKTIDVTPETTARPSPKTSNTTQSVLGGTNVVSGNNFAQEQAFEQAAYQGGWALSGFWDGAVEGKNYPNESLRLKRDALEDLSYTVGQKAGNQVREIAKDAKKNIGDLWDKKPSFEIPKIQVPKFNFPELPKLDIPKIPEFNPQPKPKEPVQPGQPKPTVPDPEQKPQPELKEKDIPRLKEPTPKPIPKTLIRQLRELELSPCGQISFGIVYCAKVTGFTTRNDGATVQTLVPSSIKAVRATSEQYGGSYASMQDFIESGGGSGAGGSVSLDKFTKFNYFSSGYGLYFEDGYDNYFLTGDFHYPGYVRSAVKYEITGLRTKTQINAILDYLTSKAPNYSVEVFYIDVTNLNAKDCPIGKPAPLPDPPPPPPKDCDCMAQCCPDIDYRKIQAMIEEAVKKLDVTAAVPLSWQIRHEGDKPQMVIQCAERKSAETAKEAAKYDSAKYPITVPHWKGGQNDKPSLPSYKKGNWEGILVLADNSKVIINAQNQAECIKILNAIKPSIDSKMLERSYFKGGKITTKEPIKEVQIYPQYGRYFKNGQKNNKPDWRVDFR